MGHTCCIPGHIYCISDQGWFSSGKNLFLPGRPEKMEETLFLPGFLLEEMEEMEEILTSVLYLD